MLPQLVNLADEEFLREFAQAVHANVHLPDPDAKAFVVSSLLAAAVHKATFFTAATPTLTYPYHMARQNPSAAQNQPVTAKAYVQAAYDLHCEEVIGVVIDRVTNTSSLAPDAALTCAQRVMLPLAAFLVEHTRTDPQKQLPSRFIHLQHTAVTQYLSWLEGHLSSVTKTEVDTLLLAASGNGEPELFLNT